MGFGDLPQQNQATAGVILNSIRRRQVRRGQRECGGWLNSPAMFEPFALAIQRLLELAQARHVDMGPEQRVTMVRAARREGDTRVWIYPTDWDDPAGIPLKEISGRPAFNLYDFMAEAGWLVELGHSERYPLQDAGPEDPVGEHALWFDVKAPVERKMNAQGRYAARSKARKASAKEKKAVVTPQAETSSAAKAKATSADDATQDAI